ncbi:MAG TPA: hypothetical protein ENH05_08030 [Rhizobiales bacterium]|nr:hypothetical protein BMS3Bbin10_02284 [bacterium BMS3Bbin10]HDO52669.1 hypothetical protein [Hyphomicrobiales bacterium]
MKTQIKVCCIAILVSRSHVAAARHALRQGQAGGLSQSLLRKPGCDDRGARIYRLPVVGAVIGEGPIVRFLETGCPDQSHKLIDRSCVLFDDIGIPETRHPIYLNALKAGHALMILQGPASELRKACEILEDICLEKPVLCFS